MTFSWRRRRGGGDVTGVISGASMELTIPNHFRCPISLDLMKDPITLSTGITYDRESIEKWMEAGKMTCPVTNQILTNFDQIPNHSIRKMIQAWCVENKSYGVERIPTPRIPITPYEVADICSKMGASTRSGDSRKCLELVIKIKNLAKESERNKRCIVVNGFGSSLADSFDSFSRHSIDKHADLLKEILSALTWTFPLGHEGVSKLKSSVSLRCIAHFLKTEDDLSLRQNAICVLKDVVSMDKDCVNDLVGVEGIEEALFQMVKDPICPRATKASLVVIHRMICCTEKSGLVFVRMGLIPLVLEFLVDGDKSVCEKALGVMDCICGWKEGRESAYQNALTVPLLVKKILRVSNAATEFCISSLSKLCLGENENTLSEAVQHGAFQKLLLVLQIGSGERTKEKVTELLKSMNLYRDKLDCFDSSMGFKHIKRPH